MRLGEMLRKYWPENAWLQGAAIFFGTLLALAIFSSLTGLLGQVCHPDADGDYSKCHSYNVAPALLWQIVVWLKDYSVLIEASSTVALVAITYFVFQIEKGRDDTTRAQLRAYVGVTDAAIQSVEVGKSAVAFYTIKNAGQTPAYEVIGVSDIVVGMYPLPKGVELPANEFRVEKGKLRFPRFSRGLLGPSQKVHKKEEMGAIITPEILAGIKDGTKAIWVYGKLWYRDALGDYWELRYRYVCGGGADANALYVDQMEEEKSSKEAHDNLLKVAGLQIPISALQPPPGMGASGT